MDGPLDFRPGQTYLLHDFKTHLVFIPLRNLFIVNDENGRHHKQSAQEYAQEKKTAIQSIKALARFRF